MPRFDSLWHTVNPVAVALLPLAAVFALVVALRRSLYRVGLLRTRRFAVPVVVVGNITVGGTGKTPLVIWIADHLRRQGWRPGIVSRGYGGNASRWPQQVQADSDPAVVGDEAVMLAARTRCPVCVGPDRPAAVEALCEHTGIDIVISDDGLQHYALARDLEIAVVDGERRFGNALPLPAGPMRERRSRLGSVDMVIVNGQGQSGEFSMAMHQPMVRDLFEDALSSLDRFAGKKVHAIAGVGNPQRFFELLRRHGVNVTAHAFPDHYAYRAADLVFEPALPVLMTEKDAVKCRPLRCRDCWVVQVDAQPDAAFVQRLNRLLKEITDGQKTAGHPGVSDLQR